MDDKAKPPTEAGNVTQLAAARLKPPSKTMVKRSFNASLARVRQETDGNRRAAEREAILSQKLSNACALLEAVVRRHGDQVFDRGEIEQLNGSTLMFDVTPTRITVRFKSSDPKAP